MRYNLQIRSPNIGYLMPEPAETLSPDNTNSLNMTLLLIPIILPYI